MPRSKKAVDGVNTSRSDFFLDVAGEVFVELGYAETTTAEVAKRAKSSKQSFYRYFPTKEELFLSVLQRQTRQVFEHLVLLSKTLEPVRPALESLASVLVDTMLSTKQIELLRIVTAEARRFPTMAENFYVSGPRLALKQLANFFAEQHQCGRLNVPDTIIAAEHFFELTVGATMRRALLGQPTTQNGPEIRGRVEAGIDVFLAAYRILPYRPQ